MSVSILNQPVNLSAPVRVCAVCGSIFNPRNAVHKYCTGCKAVRRSSLKKKKYYNRSTNRKQDRDMISESISSLIEYRQRLASEICRIDAAAKTLRKLN